MGGTATFAGTNHQAGVIAYAFVHMLAQRRLDWLTPLDDTPLAVSAETGGPGDDVGVEFGDAEAFEVQAKAGLIGELALTDTIQGIANRERAEGSLVVLAVDRRSSGWIYREFATELERIRGGRFDVLPKAQALHAEFGVALGNIRVKAVDVSPPDDPEAQRAKDLLRAVLVDPQEAEAAWALLLACAADTAARRLRKDRAALIGLLGGHGIAVRTLSPDERWLAQLDSVRQLLERRQAGAAASVLDQLEAALEHQPVGEDVRYWLARHRATALLQLNRHEDALASARRALEVNPDGPEALVSAAIASLQLGDIPSARGYADAAVRVAPESDRAWGAVAQVQAAAGEEPPVPPAAVASSTHFLTVLAENALISGDATRTLELTERILAGGPRPPEVLVFRALALLERDRNLVTAQLSPSNETEEITSEAIDQFDDVHPLKAKALVLRAASRQASGRVDEAEADLRLASNLDPDDPDVVRNSVAQRLQAGDDDGALELLHRPVAASDALLLAIRAEVFARRGRRSEAEHDVDKAMTLVADSPDPDSARLAIADAALELGDQDGAARALEGLTERARVRPVTSIFQGRVAFARGDIEGGEASYRRGAEAAGDMRDLYITELGVALVRHGRYEDAVRVFSELDQGGLPDEPRRALIMALVRTLDLAGARDQIELLAANGPLPAWAVGVSVDIALAREDAQEAIARLAELVERGEATNRVRIVLAHQFLEVNRPEDATREIEAVLLAEEITAEERMQVAELLRQLGRGPEAVHQAFRGFRDARDDPRMHRALAGMVFASRIELPPPEAAGADTHIQLSGEHGELRHHTILSDPPFQPSLNEISVEDAERLGLVGKRHGDVIVEHEGSWNEKRWTVDEVIPAVVHFARDAIAFFEQRFPSEPFFATSVHVGDGAAPADFTRVIQALGERRSRVEETLALLRDQPLPLGMVVRLLGGTLPELMELLIAGAEGAPPLWVEWDDVALQAWSLERARNGSRVVLTRSALKTMLDGAFADVVADGYELLAPAALIDELRDELSEARDQLEHGRFTMMSGDIGIRIEDVPAGDPTLVAALANLQAATQWVTRHARIEARPLQWIKPEDGSPTGLRQTIGKSSYDSLVLALHLDATLYADDLGLRRLALTNNDRPDSFSTVTLLQVLAERGLIEGRRRDDTFVALAIRNYLAIPPSAGTLIAALRSRPALEPGKLARVFATLWRPGVSPAVSAVTIAQVCRTTATAAVQLVPATRVAELGLEALGDRVPRPLAARLVEQAVSDTLRLLPRDLDGVRRVCARFAAGQ